MKPITILSYRRDVAPASDDVLEEALPRGNAYCAADLRRSTERTEKRLFRFLKRQGLPGLGAYVLSAGDGEAPQTLVRIRRTERAWVLELARDYPIRMSQPEQVRLILFPGTFDRRLPIPGFIKRNGVAWADEDFDLRQKPKREKIAKAEPEDTSYLDGFSL